MRPRIARARISGIALGLITAAALAGCGGTGYGKSSPPPTTAASTAATGSAGAHRVTATESEYKIALSVSSVPAGRYTIDAVNKGAIEHVLAIAGPGVAGTQTSTIPPRSSQTLTVTLAKGTYDVYCPLPGHKALGMDTKLTVR